MIDIERFRHDYEGLTNIFKAIQKNWQFWYLWLVMRYHSRADEFFDNEEIQAAEDLLIALDNLVKDSPRREKG